MKLKNKLILLGISIGVISCFGFNNSQAEEITSVFSGETITRDTVQNMSLASEMSTDSVLGISGTRESGNIYTWNQNTVGEAKTVWKIAKYSSEDSNIRDYSNLYYCLNAERGFGLNDGEMAEGSKDIYSDSFDMKDSTQKSTITNLAGGNLGTNYNKILWILDNSYIPGTSTSTDKANLLKKAASYRDTTRNFSEYLSNTLIDNDSDIDLTDEQIEVVQQLAIWHFTNGYNVTSNILYKNGKEIDGLGDNYDVGNYGVYFVREGAIIAWKMEALYNYFVEASESNYSSVAPTLTLSNTGVTVTESGDDYVVGPFSLTGTNTELIKSITANVSVDDYTLLNSSETVVDDNDFSKVIGNNFYLKIAKSKITKNTDITINLTYKYDEKELTVLTDRNDSTNTQPVVLVKSKEKDPSINTNATIELTSISVEKVWNDGENQDGVRPTSVNVQLYKDTTAYGSVITLSNSNSWNYTWTNLLDGYTYTLKELNNSGSEIKNGEKYNNDYTAMYIIEGSKTTIINIHIPATINISGTKTWKDNNNQDGKRPESITVNLLANGTKIQSKTVSSPWTYSFTNLPKYAEGRLIEYTITEDVVAEYTTTINKYDITNEYVPKTIQRTVTKEWNDSNNQNGIRPTSVEITLYKTVDQIKEEVEKIELNSTNNWTYTWDDLAKYEDGKEIIYSVAETVPESYTPTYSEDTFTITNTYTPDKTSKTVIKEWEDNNNQDGVRPDTVRVQLYANDTVYGELIELNERNSFTYTWTELPLKENGVEIVYSVEEVEVPAGYAVEYSSEDYSETNEITITNSYTPGVVNKTVIKKWEDNNNQDKIRTTSVEVQLYKTVENTKTSMGEEYKVVLNEENNWTYTWENLAAKEASKEIVYSVEEVEVPAGYAAEYSSEDYSETNEITITNTHIPATLSKTVIKKWEDSNNQDKIRPESVEVQLYKTIEDTKTSMGEQYKVVLNEENNWTYTWENLPLKENGVEIIYSVEEVEVPEGYTVEYSSEDYSETNEIIITNTHIPNKFDLALRKFITQINDETYSREPVVDTSKLGTVVDGKTVTTATYKHSKQPIAIQKGDVVTYTIRVYNEGEVDGYVDKITDYLPDNLLPILSTVDGIDTEKYKEEIKFNENWLWIFEENILTTTITSKSNTETYSILTGLENVTDTKLDAYVEGSNKLDYIDVQIKCLVTDSAIGGEYLTNIAEITEAQDINGNKGDGFDSELNNVDYSNLTDYKNNEAINSTTDSYVPGQEDDDDFEKLVVKEFDLALRKFITKVNETTHSREPKVDTSKLGTIIDGKTITTASYNHTKEAVIVETADLVTYKIRIYNEGTIAGFANEITDNIPEGLEFLPNSDINVSYRWKMLDSEGNETDDVTKAVMITTDYLSDRDANNIIREVTAEADGTKTLSYKDVEVQFKVTAVAKKLQDNIIINEAQISADSDRDIDSVPNRDEKYDYDLGNNEDDIDYEPIKLQYFDLALRKFITKVNSTDYNNRYPEIKYNDDGSITYNHTKDPVLVTTGDTVIYTLRVYNEGEKAGYATEIKDNLPEGLAFDPNNETNKAYGWKMIDEDGNVTEEAEKVVAFKTNYLENEKIDGLVEENGSKILYYKDVQIAFIVTESNTSDKILVNTAQISADSDDDIDSTPDNSIESEDDIDKEYVKVEYFDLALEKWVAETRVTLDGKTTTTKTGFTEDSEGMAKVDIVASKLKKTTVKFVYNIKVTNEGELPGYAYEVKDYIPSGFKFVAEDNKDWKEAENGTVVTDMLKDTLLNPGESATVEIVLTWKNSSTNLGVKTNYAEISNDSGDDIDSTPDNYDFTEDDMDDAQVILSIKTAGKTTYIGLVLISIAILAGGIVLIKKYVLD